MSAPSRNDVYDGRSDVTRALADVRLQLRADSLGKANSRSVTGCRQWAVRNPVETETDACVEQLDQRQELRASLGPYMSRRSGTKVPPPTSLSADSLIS